MSADYKPVQDALAAGADPAMLCMTCPWDRLCIQPPSMTRQDIDKQMADAQAKDNANAEKAEAEGREVGLPVGVLMTALSTAGRATAAQICPVVAARLQGSDGRQIAEAVRQQMQGWAS